MKGFLSLVCIFFSSLMFINAQPIKRIYIANDDHTDYMWTGNEVQYDSTFVKMLDYYIHQIDSTKNMPSDYQSRFNCDGSIWVKTYRKYRTDAQYKKLIEHIRSGHISVPLNFIVSTYGAQPTEAILRGMYYSGKLERENNFQFPLAVCMENQTLPLGLSSLWAGSGAKYSWRGVCACASRITERLSERKHPLYHYTGTDNQSVLMKWYNRAPGSVALGGYAEARTEKKIKEPFKDVSSVVLGLETMCDTINANSKYPYNVVGAFGYGWDDLSTFTPAFTQVAQSLSTPFRKVRVSNEMDFFHDIEKSYKNLPSQSLTYGNEWDLYCASMNETTAQVRRATEKLRTAESLATLVSLKDKTFMDGLSEKKEQAWDGFGFYWEHDWTADGPVKRQDRADWQLKQKNYITSYVDTLYSRSLAKLGEYIQSSSKQRFYVYNALNWTRSDVSDFEYLGKQPVKIIDISTGKEVESQLITKSGKQFVRIWAENIPSVGYKVYEIREGSAQKLTNAASFDKGVFKNKYYKIQVSNSGVITSLIDTRAANKQLVKQINNRYFNDLGTTNINSGQIAIENEGPVSVTVKAISSDPVPHVVKITLYSKSDRIDIENNITANFEDVKTWSFSLNLDNPTTKYEELGSVITAKKQSRGGSYANTNARYDWQTFNHFANLNEKGYNVTISNQDCSFFKLGQSTADSLWESSAQLNALAGGQIDKDLGIYKQNGETNFQYNFAFVASKNAFDQAASMKLSLEHQNPLIAAMVSGKNASNSYPEKSYSFLKINNPKVFLWALKPSEEGIRKGGVVARFWNLNQTKVKPSIITAGIIKEAYQTSHIETDKNAISLNGGFVPVNFKANQLNTYRIVFK